MSTGKLLRQGVEVHFEIGASTIEVFRDYGTARQTSAQMKALKNNEKGRLDKVMFQFLDRADISVGDVIQQKGSRDFWNVIEIEDIVEADVFLMLEAKVVRLDKVGKQPASPKSITFAGPVFGAVQINSPQSSQTVSVMGVSMIQNDLGKLKELLHDAALSDFKKEEATLALDRLAELAKRAKSAEVSESAKEKLDFLNKLFATVSTASGVAIKAAPYVHSIAKYFGL